MNGGGSHHISLRRRLAERLEPFPARGGFKRLLDRLMYAVAIFSPLALLPQVLQIFINRDVSSLSIYTWGTLTLVNTLWALYGFVHKDKPILIANLLIALLDLAIVIGILKFGILVN